MFALGLSKRFGKTSGFGFEESLLTSGRRNGATARITSTFAVGTRTRFDSLDTFKGFGLTAVAGLRHRNTFAIDSISKTVALTLFQRFYRYSETIPLGRKHRGDRFDIYISSGRSHRRRG